ncbi:MAG: DUF1294 domain-containing protein [Clostridiaceae bacterium]
MICYYLIFINVLGLLIVLKDKKAAIKHHWRIKEKTIFMTAFLGGSIGVFLGMELFRHKTKHKKFIIGIPLIIIVQILLFSLRNSIAL